MFHIVVSGCPLCASANEFFFLLAVIGRKMWSFPKLGGDCATGARSQGAQLEDEINEACTFMMQQLHKLCDAKKVSTPNTPVLPLP